MSIVAIEPSAKRFVVLRHPPRRRGRMTRDEYRAGLIAASTARFVSDFRLLGMSTASSLADEMGLSRRQVERHLSRLCRSGLALKLQDGEIVPFGDVSLGAHTEAEYRLVSRWERAA